MGGLRGGKDRAKEEKRDLFGGKVVTGARKSEQKKKVHSFFYG